MKTIPFDDQEKTALMQARAEIISAKKVHFPRIKVYIKVAKCARTWKTGQKISDPVYGDFHYKAEVSYENKVAEIKIRIPEVVFFLDEDLIRKIFVQQLIRLKRRIYGSSTNIKWYFRKEGLLKW